MNGLTKIGVTALVAFAAVSGTAMAQDFRSPDARDSSQATTQAATSVTDLRSPDARDASSRPVTTYGCTRRCGRHGSDVPGRVLPAARPQSQASSNSFSWGDAGIGAAGMLALLALFAGTLIIVSPRRRGRRLPIATR